MASIKKSTLSKSRRLANWGVLGACLVLALPSWAGRDAGQMIAQASANKETIARRQAALDTAASAPVATSEVLPLDHGPRATTTPWLNAQRRLHAQEAAERSAPAPAVTSSK
jgi:hypothetical protein